MCFQNKIVTLSDLPNSKLLNIGTIPSHFLFPILGRINIEPEFLLHSDGSLFQIFKMNEISNHKIDRMIENMPENSSIQFYRIHEENGMIKNFFCLRIEMDYSFLKINGREFYKTLFLSSKTYAEDIEKLTRERFESAKGTILEDVQTVDMKCNEVYERLCEYDIEEDFVFTKYPLRSNVSAILTGKSRHSCVFSINNLDLISSRSGILKNKSFLEIATIVKPSNVQKTEIQKSIDLNQEMLAAIKPSNLEARDFGVDTMIIDADNIINEMSPEIFFINVSFCLYENSLSELRNKFREFEDVLYRNEIVIYCHSNSARAQYISLFPGNAVYGEYWNKCYKVFGSELVSKVMAL